MIDQIPKEMNVYDGSIDGILQKRDGCLFGRWRRRRFSVRDEFLMYSKPISPESNKIGVVSNDCGIQIFNTNEEPTAITCLEVAGFRETTKNGRKFYVFSSTRTLQLRAFSNDDRSRWIRALTIARDKYSQKYSIIANNISFSSRGLSDHLHARGFGENLTEESNKRRNELEEVTFLVGETSRPTGRDISNEANANSTETSEDSEETFYDASDTFTVSEQNNSTVDVSNEMPPPVDATISDLPGQNNETGDATNEMPPLVDATISDLPGQNNETGDATNEMPPLIDATISDLPEQNNETGNATNEMSPCVARRTKLPEPREKAKAVGLWSVMKDSIGKNTTNISLPVYFHEPLSALQKGCEEFKDSHLLDEGYQHGKMGNNVMRVMKVAAFALAPYSSTEERSKPFNPMLGETFEADFPEKGIRFISEKVSHRPVILAYHCEGNGWKFYGDSILKSKFRGQTIQVDPVGILTIEFEDGEVFTWSKVKTTINIRIMGKPYCNHYGTMYIKGNRGLSCELKFEEKSRRVEGHVEDSRGNKVASLTGEWNANLRYRYEIVKSENSNQLQDEESLLWKRNDPPTDPNRYNLSRFGVTLNELTPELQVKLPCTDSRLRKDIRHLENGEYDNATSEKNRLEQRQRQSKHLQEGWKPRWFEKDGGTEGAYKYVGGYWEAKDRKSWQGCPNVFGDI